MADRLQVAIDRGVQADALLRSEMLTGAFTALRDQYMKTWDATTGPEAQARENLWLACKRLDDVRNHLTRAVRDGKIARQDVERMAGINRAA